MSNITQTKKFVRISNHAIERFRELCILNKMEDYKIERIIMGMFRNGIPIGAQLGTDFLICNTEKNTNQKIVFACREERDFVSVKTVLTYDHAMANMEASIKKVARANEQTI